MSEEGIFAIVFAIFCLLGSFLCLKDFLEWQKSNFYKNSGRFTTARKTINQRKAKPGMITRIRCVKTGKSRVNNITSGVIRFDSFHGHFQCSDWLVYYLYAFDPWESIARIQRSGQLPLLSRDFDFFCERVSFRTPDLSGIQAIIYDCLVNSE